ncbi:DUF389 domain-containing protein [Verrucomicrobiaceae bacterium N1E253]|uniref:DUF389 domain-containing protein n=1 Tax=Oceaniferula marina TaxID=2748318 RepID=A0A851GQZ0_9BACT|nr:DUF389 domain-containing protein [Oceaniferula marina]NWK57535.1 DUF389 domain-containing protein [Oceaniferula marina]
MLLIIRKQAEALAMTRWGMRIAQATKKPLHLLWVESGNEECDGDVPWLDWSEALSQDAEHWGCLEPAMAAAANPPEGSSEDCDIRLCRVECRSRHRAVLAVERKLSPELLVVGRHDSTKDGSMTGKLARELLDEAFSTVLVLRLGEVGNGASGGSGRDDLSSPGILVPCAGGRHSRRGMKLAARIAGSAATAFYVCEDAGELSMEVGYESLRRSLRRAGVTSEEVTPKVVLSDDVSEAIQCELRSGDYGLMLIGAAGGGTLRRKLFGTVPERLIQGPEGVSIGVIRASRPAGHRMRERLGDMMSLSIPQLKREERIQLFAEIDGKARWSFDFAVLMVMATCIAGLGLLADSGAVVIGAMLVAPLMTPLLGGGLAVVQGNWPLWKQCQKSVLLGFLSALLIGVLLGGLARSMGLGVTDELLARGEPTLLDLGVAFISGLAASYCLARPKLTGALAGVAIAAALVPPIATTGICLSLGESGVAKGAALLFGTNVVAIVLGSSINFLLAGVRGRSSTPRLWAQRLAILLALLCAGLSVPLASVLVGKASRKEPVEMAVQGVLETHGYRLVGVHWLRPKGGERVLELHLEGAGFPSEETMEMLREAVQTRYGKPVNLRIRLSWVREIS